jgi:hypothetical protein
MRLRNIVPDFAVALASSLKRSSQAVSAVMLVHSKPKLCNLIRESVKDDSFL